MSSYYHMFTANFARVAQPLHRLTAKDINLNWAAECKAAFTCLKNKLATPPILAYHCCGKDFTLEIDALMQGLEAILSQVQKDGNLHPVAYAS